VVVVVVVLMILWDMYGKWDTAAAGSSSTIHLIVTFIYIV